ncbi:MAG TPA: FtsX-like permease family protein [Solirubrobacteraceae bacterium]
MTRLGLKAIAARRARTLLSCLAVVLGVGMVSAAFTLSDTLRHAADSLTSSSYRGTDAVIDARTAFKLSQQGNASPPTIPASLLGRVRALPQVATAIGDLTNTQTRIIDARGSVVGHGPYFGVGFDATAPGAHRLTPFRLSAGHFAVAPDQVVIDAGTAAKLPVGVGGQVRIEGRGPVRTFTVSGIATFGAVNSIGSATFAVFDLGSAQRLFDESDRYDSILIAARRGVTTSALRQALSRVIPASAQVQSAAAQDRFTLTGLKQFISIIEIALLAFGGIAIFVGAFTIFNTLSITVAQRSRELAMLRTVGASRRQVLGSVLLEALVMGVVASLVGLFGGLGLAGGLSSLMRSLGLALPQAGTVFAIHTVIVAMLVGVLVTALAGLGPALKATRISPVVALREGGLAQAPRSGRRIRWLANGLAGVALGLLVAGMFAGGIATGTRFALIVPGCLLLFIAVALLSARIAARLASVLGRPAERLGGAPGGLARRNAMRNPARTASTAAALMIGVALVVFVSVIASGLRQSTTGTLEHQIKAGYVVAASDGNSPIDPGVAGAISGASGVRSTSSIAQDQVRAFGRTVTINGVVPSSIGAAYRYDWKSGSDAALRTLDGSGAIVDAAFASSHHLVTGSRFRVGLADGRSLALVLRGIDVPPKWGALGLGPITVSTSMFRSVFPGARDRLTFVMATGRGAAAALRARLSGFPGVQVYSPAAFATKQLDWVSQMLAMIYVLLALAVLASLLGIVNTLALSVFERTRELGMLRAVGMTRRQVRRMIRHESIVTALLGATLGIAVGLFLAALVTAALSGDGLQFALPLGSLVAFVVIAVLAGMVAAVAPARRASRLDPLSALAYE